MKERWPHLCENAQCPNHGRIWRDLSGKTRGVLLQKHWCCGVLCMEQVARDLCARLISEPGSTRRREARLPLGLVLLSAGVIDDRLLKNTLDLQRQSGSGRLGDLLMQSGALTEQQITTALGVQWNCPVFPLEECPKFLELAGWVPLPLLESFHMALVHYLPASDHLYVAFSEGVDYSVLYALEQLFDCRTEPSLASRSALDRALVEIRRHPRPPERLLEDIGDPASVARVIRQHVASLNADEVRIVRCGVYVWARIRAPKVPVTNLLFRLNQIPAAEVGPVGYVAASQAMKGK